MTKTTTPTNTQPRHRDTETPRHTRNAKRCEVPKFILIGKFGKTHAIKGDIRVYAETGDIKALARYSPWYLKTKSGYEPIKVDKKKHQNTYLLTHINNINTPENAARLTNQKIYITQDQLPSLDNDHYYWSDLIDMTVINIQGELLGQVIELMETGAHDVLIVQGDRRRLIPFIRSQIIKTIEKDKQTMIVDWDVDY